MDVFIIIDDQNHKNAESNLREFYLRHLLDFPRADADFIRRNYDKIGVLIEAGLVPKKTILSDFWCYYSCFIFYFKRIHH